MDLPTASVRYSPRMADGDGQLDLLGGLGVKVETKANEPAIRWLAIEGAGKVGRAMLPEDEALATFAREHRLDLILAIAEHRASRVQAAKDAGVDLRALDPSAAA